RIHSPDLSHSHAGGPRCTLSCNSWGQEEDSGESPPIREAADDRSGVQETPRCRREEPKADCGCCFWSDGQSSALQAFSRKVVRARSSRSLSGCRNHLWISL